jgi:AmmeMemoRadiSam system protein A
MTPAADRARLLRIARVAIESHVNTGRSGQDRRPTDFDATFDAVGIGAGVFVTLHHGGDLRGCIGHVEAVGSLAQSIAHCAVAACSADPRFPAVTPQELADLHLELSLLGPLEPAAGPADIEVGRHGLVVERGHHRGLLLPQVAIEHGWDAATFLEQTCRKAGLPSDGWQHGAAIWRFEAEVFGDGDY